jgi:hypothetical protein
VITDGEIEEKAREFRINPADVEKDYVYGWVLNALYTQSTLGNQLVLKGGNGLRKAYLPNTRQRDYHPAKRRGSGDGCRPRASSAGNQDR